MKFILSNELSSLRSQLEVGTMEYLAYVHLKNRRAIFESMLDNKINIQSTDEELMLAVQKERSISIPQR